MSSLPEIREPAEVPALRAQMGGLVARARALVVNDPVSRKVASADLRRAVDLKRAIENAFREPKAKADAAHKSICKLEKELLAEPAEAERILKKEKIGPYDIAEEERVQREEARIAAELKRGEEDERLAKAEALSDAGHKEEAEHLLEQPIVAPVVRIEREKSDGESLRRPWTFRILDESKIDRRFLMPDEKKIRQTVAAMGPDAVEVVGGIEVLRDTIVAVR